MSTPIVPSLIYEQLAELPDYLAVPEDRVLMVFKGLTMFEAMQAAERAHISNPEAWSRRACLCGEWTLAYEVRA
jgi:hypothetical protein